MPLVITVAQQKGGSGKTTLAANLAVALARKSDRARRVAIWDADPQRSLTKWWRLRERSVGDRTPLEFLEIAGWRIAMELERFGRPTDLVVIDTPPQIDVDARQAVRVADLVLVPLQPSAPDLWAAEGTLRLAESERRPARLALNRAPAGSRMRAAMEAEIATRALPVLGAVLGNRAAFASSFAAGLSVLETAPRSTAATEMALVADEVATLTG